MKSMKPERSTAPPWPVMTHIRGRDAYHQHCVRITKVRIRVNFGGRALSGSFRSCALMAGL